MKKAVLLSVSGFLLFFLLVLFAYQFYLPRVNYYLPLNIGIKGLNTEQAKQVKVFGITPLTNAQVALDSALTGRNINYGLFNQVYINLSKVTIDSVKEISVYHGVSKYTFTRTGILPKTGKDPFLFYLPGNLITPVDNRAKIFSLIYCLFNLPPFRILSFPALLLLLSACFAAIHIKCGKWLNQQAKSRLTHLSIYVFCLLTGILYMTTFNYSDKVWLGGDSWEYQSLAVNLVYGQGFPIEGGKVDSSKYQMYTNSIPFSQSWKEFYGHKSGPSFYRNPVYPLFIASVYKTFSASPKTLRIIQFMLLIIAGSLIPYIGYKLSGEKVMLPGIFAYLIFLVADHRYAFEVMAEAIIVPYVILLVLSQLLLRYNTRKFHAICFGVLLGFGPLVKNYFLPLFLLLMLFFIFRFIASKAENRKNLMLIVVSALLTIAPWTFFANYQNQKHNPHAGPIFITTQGEDVLLGSNNEFAADGEWHPEWHANGNSYYNQPNIKNTGGVIMAACFYATHPEFIAKIIPAKLIKGFMASNPQILFYFSVILWLLGNANSYLRNNKMAGIVLFMIPFSFVISYIFGRIELFPNIHVMIFSSTQLYPLFFCMLVFCTYGLIRYYKQQDQHQPSALTFSVLLISNFLLLTIVFYGSERISGVIDFIFILLALQIQFDLLARAKASLVQQL